MINLVKELSAVKDFYDPKLLEIIFKIEAADPYLGTSLLALHVKMMELHNKEIIEILKEYNG